MEFVVPGTNSIYIIIIIKISIRRHCKILLIIIKNILVETLDEKNKNEEEYFIEAMQRDETRIAILKKLSNCDLPVFYKPVSVIKLYIMITWELVIYFYNASVFRLKQ